MSLANAIILLCIILQSAAFATDPEANVLLNLKQQLRLPPSLPLLQSWNITSKHQLCSSWEGITCNGSNESSLIISINLAGQELGSRSSSLDVTPLFRDLPALDHLNLSSTALHGSIFQQPSSSCSSSITLLDLSSNSLSGTIPSFLGNCSGLQELTLSTNMLTGSIPTDLARLAELEVLGLDNNLLGGGLPPVLANCSKLTSISLDKNQLTGSIPDELGRLANLQVLSLSENNLTGTLPASLGNCSNLVWLLVYRNGLSGQVPPELGMLNKVETLYFDLNHFSGQIPASLSNCSALSRILFFSNNLTGTIPPQLGLLKNLFTLELSYNKLSGRVGFELGELRNSLRYIGFDSNNLYGEFPSSIVNCTSLITMLFSGNHFVGSIPHQIGDLVNLTKLRLHDNQLSGEIPSRLGNLTLLGELTLQSNNLEGRLPSQLSTCKSLVEMDLSVNKLVGEIPSSLCNLSQLQKLNLSNNQLSGEIPQCLASCFRLLLLDFSFNSLVGTIPPAIPAGLSNLALGFVLSNNQLQGEIPRTIGSMTMVQNIDLSVNNFSGEIPSSLAACTGLQHLDLSSNSLTSSIPDIFAKLGLLQTLNVSRNNLNGPLPASLQALKLLSALDISSNEVSGKIPSFLTSLPSLVSLNLSHNHMVGPIPNSGIFLNLTPSSLQGNPGPLIRKECQRKSRIRRALPVLVVGFFFILLPLALWCFSLSHQKPVRELLHFRQFVKEFTTRELFNATGGYNSENIVGVGADAVVYKGRLMDGTLVAVKKFKAADVERRDKFVSEMRVLGRIRHRSLIKILGYGLNRSIVLEFMPNGNLDTNLHRQKPSQLTWGMRLQIAIDVAHALSYLHHDCAPLVVHCDLKPSNILLDFKFRARIADFGISKAPDPTTSAERSLSLAGTTGYIPPEYNQSLNPSTKGDVYCYGVILLELVTGVSPTSSSLPEGLTLSTWVSSSEPLDVVDQNLLRNLQPGEWNEMLQVIKIALHCTSYSYTERPDMDMVVKAFRRLTLGLTRLGRNVSQRAKSLATPRVSPSEVQELPGEKHTTRLSLNSEI